MAKKAMAVVWPEWQPHNAVFAYSPLHKHWLEFKLGLRSMWPNPLDAKRICCYRFWTGNYTGKSAFDIALATQHVMSLNRKVFPDG